VQGGTLGEARVFSSVFSMQVPDPDNIRLMARTGGGPLYDIGIYCINAARSLFAAEPEEVIGVAVHGRDPRFEEVPEMCSAILRYPGDRLATFTCSFGASSVSTFEVVGTKGRLRLDPAYDYQERLAWEITIDERTKRKSFPKRDQFAAELTYFSDCVLNGTDPEPSGLEGLADVRIIRALHESAESGRVVRLRDMPSLRHPSPDQRIDRPPHGKPTLVRVASPSGD
jgi:glucose-fructose oxidoreductase